MAIFRPSDREPAKRIVGFDDTASPPWMMVPAGEFRTVTLAGGAGLSLRLKPVWDPDGKGVVTVTEQSAGPSGPPDRSILLTANAAGTTVLEARDANGMVQAAVEITVMEQVKLATVIHFVFDKNGRTTNWDLGRARQTMEAVNNLLRYQVNVQMVFRGSGVVHLPFELPRGVPANMPSFNAPRNWQHATPGPLPCYSFRAPAQVGCEPPTERGTLSQQDDDAMRKFDVISNILSRIDPGSDYNIFCVERLDQPGPFFTLAFTPSNLRGVEVNAYMLPQNSFSLHLAHELGHYLLRPSGMHSFTDQFGHSSGTYDLMQERPGPGDPKLYG